MKELLKDANFPRDAEGRTYHVGTKPGQVANRIITVGDSVRARRIAAHFDGAKASFEHMSQRNFLTLTGTYQGVPISVVAIGMGFPLVDFFIRETRAVVEGDMIVVRLGSCGSISKDVSLGTVVTPYESFGVFRNCDWWSDVDDEGESKGEPYTITNKLACDREVHDALLASLETHRPASNPSLFSNQRPLAMGDVTNGSADSFYSSQGRRDPSFDDANSDLIEKIKTRHPDAKTFEMETYLINHLARCASRVPKDKGGKGRIRTGAAQMIFADRSSSGFIKPEEVEALEEWAGKSVCHALVGLKIDNEVRQ